MTAEDKTSFKDRKRVLDNVGADVIDTEGHLSPEKVVNKVDSAATGLCVSHE